MVYFTVVFWTTKYKPWENYNLWFYAYTPGDVFSSQVLWDGPDLASQLAGAGDLVSKFKGVFLQVGLQWTYHSMSKKKKKKLTVSIQNLIFRQKREGSSYTIWEKCLVVACLNVMFCNYA